MQLVVDTQVVKVMVTRTQVAHNWHLVCFQIFDNRPSSRHLNKIVAPKYFCRLSANLTVDSEDAGVELVGRWKPGVLRAALWICACLLYTSDAADE